MTSTEPRTPRRASQYRKPVDATPEEASLIDALRREYSGYVVLQAHGSPGRVAKFAARQLGLGEEGAPEALQASLEGTYFFNPLGVAQALLAGREAFLAAQGEIDHEFLDAVVDALENASTVPAEEVDQLFEEYLEADGNPFAGLDPDQSFGAKEAAALMGRSYGYMKDHGAEIGGTKTVRGAWQFTAAALTQAWPNHKGDK